MFTPTIIDRSPFAGRHLVWFVCLMSCIGILGLGWVAPPVVAGGSIEWGHTEVDGRTFYATQSQGTDVGYTLMVSDESGTRVVKEFHYEADVSARFHDPVAFQGKLFFGTSHMTLGDELWMSDGTEAGTQIVKDIFVADPDYQGAMPDALTVAGDTLFFAAIHPDTGRELWATDGTEAGTRLVKDINPGDEVDFMSPRALVAVRDKLVFLTGDSHADFWLTDGTEEGTRFARRYDGEHEPGPWETFEIGTVDIQQLVATEDTVLLGGNGEGLGGYNDNVSFVYQEVGTDDVMLTTRVRLDTLDGIGFPRAGIMLRRDTDDNVVFAALTVQRPEGAQNSDRVLFQVRAGSGLPVWTLADYPQSEVMWLRLEKRGDTVTGLISTAEAPAAGDWHEIYSKTLPFGSRVRAGMFVTPQLSTKPSVVLFEHVSLTAPDDTPTHTPTPTPIPTPTPETWQEHDVGWGEYGSMTVEGDTIRLSGSGAGLGGYSDEFVFAFQEVGSDDVTLTARVRLEDLYGIGAPQAGLMLRRDIDPNVVFAALTIQQTEGAIIYDATDEVLFQVRSGSGLPVWTLNSHPQSEMMWLRLVKEGDTATGLISTAEEPAAGDWHEIYSQTLPFGSHVRAGFFVTSQFDKSAEVIFTDVSLER
jgi:ELWxxDGT repeat protein